ncbi:peptidylprolyl isomerase [Tenacibaculum aiptasiae]|uniref:Peptidylprolyl isomerase n=1 Tax=Tenacibaculum aiptasiae TaxID=426481 RepID=A0A7J5APL7_9FLAO|nr:peptidylprolyl isomerase [Tenacibaculum aiptasiae]KAB1159507.1 peptidylprolyl isomerase [Tenacibaculum aiptasiae]
MIKFKHFFYAAIVSIILYSCGGSSSVANFDHAAQALIDNDSLIAFLKNNYYNATLDSVKVIDNGQTSLFDDPNLKTKEVKEGDVDYKLYYYVNRVGTPVLPTPQGFPTVVDSIYAKYRGQRIMRRDSLSPDFDNSTTWFMLSRVIRGWTYSFIHFKGGENITNNGPITYVNGGKGILFIPSGLGYREVGRAPILANENLLFYFELRDLVENTDEDRDGIPSIFEDLDGDGDPRNDDTDGDNRPNFTDLDDDGDGKLTKDEDANGDGDPRNDFSDPNKPTVPDYLNRDIK